MEVSIFISSEFCFLGDEDIINQLKDRLIDLYFHKKCTWWVQYCDKCSSVFVTNMSWKCWLAGHVNLSSPISCCCLASQCKLSLFLPQQNLVLLRKMQSQTDFLHCKVTGNNLSLSRPILSFLTHLCQWWSRLGRKAAWGRRGGGLRAAAKWPYICCPVCVVSTLTPQPLSLSCHCLNTLTLELKLNTSPSLPDTRDMSAKRVLTLIRAWLQSTGRLTSIGTLEIRQSSSAHSTWHVQSTY